MGLREFVSLLFPNECPACGGFLHIREQLICTSCLGSLPFNRHINAEEAMMMYWHGRNQAQGLNYLLKFEKQDIVQDILHHIKYKGRKDLAFAMGKLMGRQVKFNGQNISGIVPVPLHSSKLKERGYNQSERISAGIGQELNIPVWNDFLVRKKKTSTQTKKSREERIANVADVFSVSDKYSKSPSLSVLLVDDVLTTGATLDSCCDALGKANLQAPALAVLAIAQ